MYSAALEFSGSLFSLFQEDQHTLHSLLPPLHTLNDCFFGFRLIRGLYHNLYSGSDGLEHAYVHVDALYTIGIHIHVYEIGHLNVTCTNTRTYTCIYIKPCIDSLTRNTKLGPSTTTCKLCNCIYCISARNCEQMNHMHIYICTCIYCMCLYVHVCNCHTVLSFVPEYLV